MTPQPIPAQPIAPPVSPIPPQKLIVPSWDDAVGGIIEKNMARHATLPPLPQKTSPKTPNNNNNRQKRHP